MSRWAFLTPIVLLTCTSDPIFAAERKLVDVGIARVDISPEFPVRLSGYLGRTQPSIRVAQKIWAKAIAIGSDQQGPVILVSVDNLGVGEAIVDEVAARLKKQANFPRANFTVSSSHTHSAPCLTGVAPNIFGKKLAEDEQAAVDRYTRELTDKIESVSLQALKSRAPGLLDWAQGSVNFAANRRTKGGPVDHAMPVLRVTDPNGKLRGVVVNYACHCTTLDPKDNTVSGDWAGFAQAAIEADHTGAIALTVIGCGADANPIRRLEPTAAADHGRAMANELKRLLGGTWIPLPGPPQVAFERFTLPFDTLPTRAELEKLVKAGGPPGYNASVHLAKLDRGEPLQSQLNYSAQAWSFGDVLAMVFIPGEVVVDYVLRLKKEYDPARIWVTAYSNDLPCYIPSERILKEGGYEGGGAMVYYARPTRLKPGVEQTIIDAVHRVVPERFAATAAKPVTTSKLIQDEMPPPKTPAEALATLHVKPGLKAELVAAEPLVESPVAVDFGTDGRLWVCEMRDYPTGINGNWKPGGVIKVLEDRDHDGTYETGTVFLDGLPFPTGVMAWRKGVLVCAAPEIIYAEDTDGDGKADLRRVLFQGFATENYQARVNGLSYGLDNWVYGANGLIGGVIRGTATGRDVNIGGRDFRIDPDTGSMEPASGLTQQGRVRDDWGNQFGGNNSVLIQHYPFPDYYARRNPRVATPSPSVFISQDAEPARLFPASVTLARYNHPESANQVTSACSPMIYRDTLLGPSYHGNSFTCEPVHNLVRRMMLEPDGVTFSGHRAADEQNSEFLASTDHWFRPVQARTGPDGALWVVDMYRFVIEHPRWISPERLATLDVRAGAKMGRIYRIVPTEEKVKPLPNLDAMRTVELTALIESSNGTLRDNVQRLLVHRADHAAVPLLVKLARTSPRPETRVQALCTLEGLHALEPRIVTDAMTDAHAEVRRAAARLAEPFLGKDDAIGRGLLALGVDADIRVRFQAALSLGEWSDPDSGRALGKIAVKDSADPWVRAAVLTSSSKHAATVLETVIAASADQAPSSDLIEPLIATLAGTQDRRAVAQALAAINKAKALSASSWQIGATAQLLDAVRDPALIDNQGVRSIIMFAREVASDREKKPAERAAAIRLLGRIPAEKDLDRNSIAERLEPIEPIEVQMAALKAFAKLDDSASSEAILARWSRLGPTVRAAALDQLLARPASLGVLVTTLEKKQINPAEIDAAHRQQMITARAEQTRTRAEAVFASLKIGSRQNVLNSYASAKTKAGDPERGKVVFGRICANCHKFGGQGHEVGPDLAALTDTTPDALMTAILDPNRDVDARYASYTAALKDGRVLNGLVASETASALVLKRQEGQGDVVLRADLDELTTAGKSLMPEGLENDIKPSELADVMAYVAQGATQPKTLEGNRPELVVQAANGVIRLPAASAAVFGPNLTYETALGNLGLWHSIDDRASWTFRVDQPGTFTVTMEWACADESAGNGFLTKVGGVTSRNVVAGTGQGTWANYRSIFLTEAKLPAGTHRLELRPDQSLNHALMDLRAVVLTPRSASVFQTKKK